MVRSARLYTYLLVCVLAAAACGVGGSDTREPAADRAGARPPDRSTPAGDSEDDPLTVLFFGDSITAGNGLVPEEAFPALIKERVDALGWSVEVTNAGLSGETSAGGLRRIDWMLRSPVDVFVLELGGNDALRGMNLAETRRNLQAIVDTVLARSPDARIVVAGMQIPPNFGPRYTSTFRDLYPELAAENDAVLIPFLMEGVGGVPSLMQGDGIHPTAEGHAVMAETTWRYLEPVLRDALGLDAK